MGAAFYSTSRKARRPAASHAPGGWVGGAASRAQAPTRRGSTPALDRQRGLLCGPRLRSRQEELGAAEPAVCDALAAERDLAAAVRALLQLTQLAGLAGIEHALVPVDVAAEDLQPDEVVDH